MSSPLTFDIKRYSINDGPGIRVTIFLKGCPLNCRWCHNPESLSPEVEKLFTAAKCIGCGGCCQVCPLQACRLTAQGVVTDDGLCALCGQCAEVCPTLATEMSGCPRSVNELLQIIERERPFFDQSNGGVTFSGGEPLLHPEFLAEILDACGRKDIHRTIDTSGYVKTEVLLRVARSTDLFLYDLKLIDAEQHKRFTGVDNRLILRNLKALAESGAAIRVRIPLIGGLNDDEANIAASADIVAGLAGEKKRVNLLPFHDVAQGKDARLGRRRDLSGMRSPDAKSIERAIEIMMSRGLEASVGG
jgi:pyruvate formate lyase activating enzyme